MSLAITLETINNSLAKKYTTRDEYDIIIQETQSVFNKIPESSQTLQHVLKKEEAQLQKKRKANIDDQLDKAKLENLQSMQQFNKKSKGFNSH